MENGYIEKRYKGKKIGFKFGTNAFEQLCKMYNTDLLINVDRILNTVGGERDLVYCAAKYAAQLKNKDFDITNLDIGDWLDGLSEKDYNDILETVANTTIRGKTVKEHGEEAERLAEELEK